MSVSFDNVPNCQRADDEDNCGYTLAKNCQSKQRLRVVAVTTVEARLAVAADPFLTPDKPLQNEISQ